MKSSKERMKEQLTYMDRWALPFYTQRDLEESAPQEEELAEDEMMKIAETLFS